MTTAQTIAEIYGNDGSNFGRKSDSLRWLLERKAVSKIWGSSSRAKFKFGDQSAIIVWGNAWDLAADPKDDECFCWDEVGHTSECDTRRSTYQLFEEGYHFGETEADSAEEALERALEDLDPTLYSLPHTATIGVKSWDGEWLTGSKYLPMMEPEGGHDHIWESPHSVVGGLKENPGVWGVGAGLRIVEVCSECGIYRITLTAVQDSATGKHREEVIYEDADSYSSEWVDSQKEDSGE